MCTNPPAAAALSRRPFSKNVVIPFIYNKYLLLLSFSRFSALHSQKAEKKNTYHTLARGSHCITYHSRHGGVPRIPSHIYEREYTIIHLYMRTIYAVYRYAHAH